MEQPELAATGSYGEGREYWVIPDLWTQVGQKFITRALVMVVEFRSVGVVALVAPQRVARALERHPCP